jgi:anti-anti-sigma factor
LDRIAKEALKETKNLVLVMNEVESVLSSGVGVLINLFRDVRGRGGRLVIANPSYEVERVLSVSRADQLVSSYPTQEEALEALHLAEAHVSPTTERGAREKDSTPTVLVLEDNPHSYRLAELALGHEFRIIHSSDVREGLRLALRNRPQVIVMDLHPPNSDSSSIVKRCRETPQIRNTPILVVTTDADRKIVEENMGHGVQDYIVKPYQSQALLEKVRSLVKKGAVGEVSDSEKGSS